MRLELLCTSLVRSLRYLDACVRTQPTVSRIRFDDRVAVITGAGRGLGRAYALEFARRGASVVVNGASGSVAGVAEDIHAFGGVAVPCIADVSTVEGGQRVIDVALEQWGRVDVLVNNAGRRSPAPFDELTSNDLAHVFDSHLGAAFHVTQPAWRDMRERGFGRIIMTSSSAGLFSNQDLSNYAAAKAGIYGLTKALAYEGRELGITCNVVLPYAVTNSAGNERLVASAEAERQRYVSEADLAKLEAARWEATLTAHLVLFLASDECTVTGEAFSSCLGRYARVFVGVADGWIAPDPSTVDVEMIATHFGEIRDLARATVPTSMYDELANVVHRIVQPDDADCSQR
jgi:NAD(P)-dependent dehydrogenase (short-subunit alcohol dehydrogenase family)